MAGSSGAFSGCSYSKEPSIQHLDPAHLFVRQWAELLLTSPLRKISASLVNKAAKPLDFSIRHLHDLFYRCRELIECFQKANFFWQVVLDSLFDT